MVLFPLFFRFRSVLSFWELLSEYCESAIFHSYVRLPKGVPCNEAISQDFMGKTNPIELAAGYYNP